jgi:3-oxoacyl-[acyl-carrier-protein] synthase II
MSRASALAVAAARSALTEARLEPRSRDEGDDLGLHVGIGMTSSELSDLERLVRASVDDEGRLSLARVGERGLRATNPLVSFRILSNMPLCHVALALGIRGPNASFHSLGGETLSALAAARDDVLEGRVRAALWGGVDAQVDPAGVLSLSRKGLLAPCDGSPESASRPFDAAGRGRVIAEGAAFAVLEREDAARARGARVLATLESVALARGRGAGLAASPLEPIERALAGASADVVFASAAGDPDGDAREAEALGRAGLSAPVLSTRGALGDALAAGPAIDLAIAVAALERGLAPPTRNLDHPVASARALDLVLGAPRALRGERALVLAAGLSATIGACVLARREAAA